MHVSELGQARSPPQSFWEHYEVKYVIMGYLVGPGWCPLAFFILVDRGSLLSRKMEKTKTKKKKLWLSHKWVLVVTMSTHELTKDVTAPEAEFRKRQNLAHRVTEETA